MSAVKNIEFTQIAADWNSIKLGEESPQALLAMRNGLTTKQDQDKGDYKVSRIETIGGGWIDETRVRFASDVREKDVENYRIQKGDILFSHINSDPHLGKTGIAERDYEDLLHGMNLLLIRANPDVFEAAFLNRVFQYYRNIGVFISICSRSVNQSSINQAKLKAVEVPLPPLPEQRKIAHILSTVQRAIEAQERIIQTTTELKKALMHKLFTEGLRHEPQKQTEIGPVPESWEVVELNQLADLKNGYAFKSTDYVAESNTLNIRMSNIRPGAQFDLEYNPRFLPDHFAETQKSFLLEDGDLIIAMTDMANDPKILGVPTIVRNPSEKKLLLNQRVGKLVPTDSRRVNLEFLRFYLSRKPAQRYLVSCAKKGVQVNIGKKDILSVPIAFPKPDEQRTIVECFNTLGDKVAAAENKVVALQDLFRTLLHELMIAKTRVHKLEFEAPTFSP